MEKKYYLFLGLFLLVLNVFCWKEVFELNGKQFLEVDFFDVGQGDSAFIQTPQGHQILIDGGPGAAILEKLQKEMPFYDRSIDLIILSHPETDHMSGIMEVLQRYKVDYFVWTGVVRNTPEYQKLVLLLQEKSKSGMKIIAVKNGSKIKAGGAVIGVIYPFEKMEGVEILKTSNNSCVVNALSYGQNNFLFAGDIDTKTEKLIANSSESVNDDFDVLKVAHHGSKYSTSEEFVAWTRAECAVIQAGKDNSYGHPAPETLQRLEKFGIKILRTDVDGDIKMLSDGKDIILKK